MTIEDNLIRILSDKEISSVNDDFLDLRNYAAVLASLIRTTDTPITIGIQGDWGSGKSSLMRLIKQEIDPDQGQNKSIYTLWFNSWQFSQFNMEEQLTISLLLHFIEKIREINGREEIAQFVDKLRKIISKLPLKKVSLGFKTNDKILPVGQFNFNVDLENKEDDPSEKIKSLDTDLKELVKKTLGDQKRLIIFIDDLDRLLPEQAVGLLESLKLFLDISGCVFVVSCDRQVVAEGIKQKFKYDDPKGKGFFDKIIQVPLNMPKYGELAMDFCSKMLKILGIEENPPIESLKQYVDLINCSVGFNPRTVKRLFNNLLLSKLIIEKGRGDSLDSKKVSILFAALCLQETYPLIYNWILRSDTSNDSFQKVMKGKSPPVNEPELEKFIHLLKDSCFSKIFSNIIGNITVEELRILISPSAKIVSTSSSPGEESTEREESTEMTDTGEPEISYIERTRYHNRKLMNTVISEAESKYGKYLEKLSPLIETTGFEKYQPVLGFNDCYMLIYLKITPSKNKDLRFEIHHEAKFEEKQKYIRHFFRWWMDQKEENSKIHNWFKDHIHSIEYFKRLPTKVQVLNQFNECRVPLYDNLDLSVGTSREDFDKIFRETTFKILDELLPKLTEFYKDGKLK